MTEQSTKPTRIGEDLEVGPLGFGAMGLSSVYGRVDRAQSLATLRHVLDCGIRLIDTADVYGDGENEVLVGEAIAGRRDEVVIATKFGLVGAAHGGAPGFRADPDYVRRAADASLLRMGIDVIDILYLHRPDPATPLTDTVAAMAELVAAGKVRQLGLCEVGSDQLREAAAVHPIAALQSEWSLFTRDIEQDVVSQAAALGVAVVPYSPLGRGMLDGQDAAADRLDPDDFRRLLPRFSPENVARNAGLAAVVDDIARDAGATVAQVALAWLRSREQVFGVPIVPIPGTRRAERVSENLGSLGVALDPAQLARLESIAARVAGGRHPAGAEDQEEST